MGGSDHDCYDDADVGGDGCDYEDDDHEDDYGSDDGGSGYDFDFDGDSGDDGNYHCYGYYCCYPMYSSSCRCSCCYR